MVSRPSQPGGMRMSTKATAKGRPAWRAWMTISNASRPWLAQSNVKVGILGRRYWTAIDFGHLPGRGFIGDQDLLIDLVHLRSIVNTDNPHGFLVIHGDASIPRRGTGFGPMSAAPPPSSSWWKMRLGFRMEPPVCTYSLYCSSKPSCIQGKSNASNRPIAGLAKPSSSL